jgi:hypothetical protein
MLQFSANTRRGSRREFPRHLPHRIAALTSVALALVLVQLLHATGLAAESSGRPNIILIMADDK